MANTRRIAELDFLRAIAILLILLHHSPDYVGEMPLLAYWEHGITTVGLGGFSFLTGYALEHSYGKATHFEWKPFLFKRLWRVYIPYLFTFGVFLFLFGHLKVHHDVALHPWHISLPVHVVGLQALLFPKYPQCLTLWYIGILLPMYLAYPLLNWQRHLSYFLTSAAVMLFLALLIRYVFHIIDIRFFLYFPVFLMGILWCRLRIMGSTSLRKVASKPSVSWLTLICFVLGYALYMEVWGEPVIYDHGQGDNTLFFALPILLTLMLIAFSLVSILTFSRHLADNKRYKILSTSLSYIGAGSFFIYLFHRPWLAVYTAVIGHHFGSLALTLGYPFAVAILIVFCNLGEKLYVSRVYKPMISAQ
ncbi:MAG: acyltransferase [Cyanobacteria bacterium P01_F01_bin.53]